MRLALFAVAALALSGCASLEAMHADYHCQHDGDASWRVIRAPADAETYRALARATPDEIVAGVEGREVWFARGDGVLKYCILDSRPGNPDCDVPRGVSWQFEQTPDGPRAGAPDYAVCVL